MQLFQGFFSFYLLGFMEILFVLVKNLTCSNSKMKTFDKILVRIFSKL